MTKFNTVKRKANVGERILITNISEREQGRYQNGDIGIVETISIKDRVYANINEIEHVLIFDDEYEVIMEASEMVKVKSLKEIVGSLVDCGYTCEAGPLVNNVDFQLLAEIAGFSGKPAKITNSRTEFISAKSPQQQQRDVLTRERIIEQAKRDVAELVARGSDANAKDGAEGNETFRENFYNVELIVNKEKRAVVALIRHMTRRGRVLDIRHRGIAKCAPTDCFNAHIGKAIAVRRSLGLEVPEVYLRAPQPTEVRLGDVVKSTVNKKPKWTVIDEDDSGKLTVKSVSYRPTTHFGIDKGILYVIDDTRDEVAE